MEQIFWRLTALVLIGILAMAITLRASAFFVKGRGNIIPCLAPPTARQVVIVFAGGVDTDSRFFQSVLEKMAELLEQNGPHNVNIAGLHNDTQGLLLDLVEGFHQYRCLRSQKIFVKTSSFAEQCHAFLVNLLAAKHPVILVGHSQGCLTIAEIMQKPLPSSDRLAVVMLSSPIQIPAPLVENIAITYLYNEKDPMRHFSTADSLLCTAPLLSKPRLFAHHRLLTGYFQGDPATVLCRTLADFCASQTEGDQRTP